MAPKKRLGVGAECTVALRFLHPKDKIKAKIPNQTSSQKLSMLVVQGLEDKSIHREHKTCVVFRHEDFGGQPLWCLCKYVKIDKEGPEASFFEKEVVNQGNPSALGATLDGHEGGGAGPSGRDAPAAATRSGTAATQEVDEDVPEDIHNLFGNLHLDSDDILLASRAAPMVDDDNMPAPENIPGLSINNASSSNTDIMIGWQHSGICFRKSGVSYNATPQLHFLPRDVGNPTILQLFEGLFFTTFVNSVIIPQTNKHL